jgi:uncharacterized protein (TIRG00374 family)
MDQSSEIGNQNSNVKNRWFVLVKLLIGLGLVVLLVWKVGLDKLLNSIKEVTVGGYLAALVAYAGGEAIRTVRWQWLLRAVGAEFRLWRLVKLQFIGAFFNHFLPTSVGGDGLRIFYLYRDGVAWEKAVGSVLVERVVGMLMLLFVGLAAAVFGFRAYREDSWILGVLAAFALGFVLGVYLLFSQRALTGLLVFMERVGLGHLRAGVERFSTGIQVYRSHPRVLLAVAAVSVAFQVVVIGLFYFFSLKMKMDVSVGYFFLFVPIALSLCVIPIPGALGILELAFVLLFSQVGAPEEKALALPMLYRLLTLGTGLLGGVVFVCAGGRENPKSQSRYVGIGKTPKSQIPNSTIGNQRSTPENSERNSV